MSSTTVSINLNRARQEPSTEGIGIRRFEDTDLLGTAAALTDVHATDGYPVEGVARPEEWLRSQDVLASWVAQAGRRIVGRVAVMRPRGEGAVSLWVEQSGDDEQRIGVLARLFVVRDAGGRAVGERLVRTAMGYGLSHDRRLVLDVMVKDAAAMRLYERLGWLRTGHVAHPYGQGQGIEAACYVAPGTGPVQLVGAVIGQAHGDDFPDVDKVTALRVSRLSWPAAAQGEGATRGLVLVGSYRLLDGWLRVGG
ncbi:GNAT family N-acetyltransferase [Streptomyces sp. NPDC051677]|uniref:GNAT family N-acetyltransferase n=1 Tax=Streptomyces sp. NPDC051677 TaxID=3365669 RepID=UPI0037D7858C